MDRPSLFSVGQHREQQVEDLRREAERQLVDHQQLRPRQQAARDGEHLLLAARQRAGLLVDPLAQAREHAEHLVDVGRDPARIGLADAAIGAEHQVVAHALVGEDHAALRHHGEAARDHLVALLARHVGAVEGDRCRRRAAARR